MYSKRDICIKCVTPNRHRKINETLEMRILLIEIHVSLVEMQIILLKSNNNISLMHISLFILK